MSIKEGARVRLLEDCVDETDNGMPPPKKGDTGILTERNVKVEGAARRVVRIAFDNGTSAVAYADQIEAI